MSTCVEADIDTAMEELLRGYEEQSELYGIMRRLTVRQRLMLRRDNDIMQFNDLLDEKEDILQLIAQIDEHLEAPKRHVLEHGFGEGAQSVRLAALLDRLADTIDEIRIMETDNASLLHVMPKAG